ncbi:hypothetical protein ACH4OY_21890 [Micromonospora rubida]|uniref:Secreted protein n=1 Tax=Micromonospora rubida TaxID=2697657 RepID=A0ABW7SNM9_9ACTN
MTDVEKAPTAASRKRGPDDRSWHGRPVVAGLTVLGVLIAGAALARDYFELTFPGVGPRATPSASQVPAGSPSAAVGTPDGRTGTSGGQSTPAGVHLDTLAVQGGGANLVELPRTLAGRGYQRSITITCPRNTSADKHRDVTYPLRRRYLDLTTIIRPYFPDDSQATAYVSAIVSVEQPDGTVNRLDRGGQAARQDTPVKLAANVENADELTLQVRCESPTGLVVLTEALLTPR